MKKRYYLFIPIAVISIAVMPVLKIYAASASVFVSPSSSSVTVGSNVTVQVRTSSATPYNAAQATLNFNSSKLQYVSYANGSFTPTPAPTIGGSSITYSGAILGSQVSGNQLLFSATFKTKATGSASLSISGARVLDAGTEFSVSSSGGSVTINSPPTSGGGTTTSKPKTSTGTSSSSPAEETDTTPPTLSGEPALDKTQSTITASFKTDEASSAVLSYAKDGAKMTPLKSETLQQEHKFEIGKEVPLEAGTNYNLELILTDEAGNSSDVFKYSVRTIGVEFRAKIVDSGGKPLANHPVELHSDPISGTTDSNGVVAFEDVTPGEHTLVFDIEGVTMRQPVKVGADVIAQGENEAIETISMPFQLAQAVQSEPSNRWMVWAGLSFLAGVVLTRLPLKKWYKKLREKAKKKPAAKPSAKS